jgi:glucosamine kinase
MLQYLVGVDGGGSGTRVRLRRCGGPERAMGQAGPSALALGADAAWAAIDTALTQAFVQSGLQRPPDGALAVGVGIAGSNVPSWAEAFTSRAPDFGALHIDSDAYTTLLGAHAGAPGAIVAVGTGIVGLALGPDGTRHAVGGWGFPGGDEGSGAWIGLQAAAHLERVVDGSEVGGPLAQALAAICGADRGALTDWLAKATQTRYASLAHSVIVSAARDPVARGIAEVAGRHVAMLAQAADPTGHLPLALCGGLAEPLRPWLPADLAQRARPPLGDSAQGALRMIAGATGQPLDD